MNHQETGSAVPGSAAPDSAVSDVSTPQSAASTFNLLYVCTANHCRSPLAEFLTRIELPARDLDWSVSSAGTRARPGQPMHPAVARTVRRLGFEPGDWSSRTLTAELIGRADLILTAEEDHRGVVAQLSPSAMGRTFTLMQFAHLVAAIPRDRPLPAADYGPRLLSEVRALRGRVQPTPAKNRDLPDPMGASPLKFRRCAAAVERSVEQILALTQRQRWSSWPSVAG